MKISILVGTMTGTAQLCAQEMELALDDGDNRVETLLMDQLDSSVFSREGVFLICTSTYGQGDVPDNAKALYDDLRAKRPNLSGVRYGVFGLGDRTYAETFNFGGKRLDDILTELGAPRIGERHRPLLDRTRERGGQLYQRIDVAADQAGHDLRGAKRHFIHFGTRRVKQGGERNMRVAADAGMAHGNEFGFRFRFQNQVIQGSPPGIRAHGDDRRFDQHARHGIERLVVERQRAGVIGGRDRVGIPHQRIAVGLLARHVPVADSPARALAVDDQHALAEGLRHALGEHARSDVRRCACREQDGDLERSLLRIGNILRPGVKGEEREKKDKDLHARISLTSTLRPSFAERIPARSTASDAVPRSPSISGSASPRTATANSSSSSTMGSFF